MPSLATCAVRAQRAALPGILGSPSGGSGPSATSSWPRHPTPPTLPHSPSALVSRKVISRDSRSQRARSHSDVTARPFSARSPLGNCSRKQDALCACCPAWATLGPCPGCGLGPLLWILSPGDGGLPEPETSPARQDGRFGSPCQPKGHNQVRRWCCGRQ